MVLPLFHNPLVRIFAVIVLVILAFLAGWSLSGREGATSPAGADEITALKQEISALETRNEELRETLNLVKRQIQTDRIAYKELQDIVQVSESERNELRKQIEDQQRLLQSLRDRLENTGS